jgi:Mediator complex protein.
LSEEEIGSLLGEAKAKIDLLSSEQDRYFGKPVTYSATQYLRKIEEIAEVLRRNIYLAEQNKE